MTHEIEQLERETEQARTELASSLDALRDRLTPDDVVEEAWITLAKHGSVRRR